MKNITTSAELKTAIEQLEEKKAEERTMLKKQFFDSCDNLRPINLLKNTIKDIFPPELKNDLLSTSIGLTVGYLTKTMVTKGSHSPLKDLMGSILEAGIIKIASENSDTINLYGKITANYLSKGKKPY